MLKKLQCFMLLVGCIFNSVEAAQVSQERAARDPEASTGYQKKAKVVAKNAMVVAANPYAVEAGYQVLKAGGTAFDAAIAVQAVLGLVEPQSSGIGGGTFILYWQADKQKLHALDGRETAPSKATAELFFEQGKPLRWHDAVVGGRSVGVPGVIAALEAGHKKFGQLAWNKLFDHAIQLSEQGFIVSPRLAKLVGMEINPGIRLLAPAKNYFYPQGQPLQAGQKIKNSAYANSLNLIAEHGSQGFYHGQLAKKISQAVQNSAQAPGLLTSEDLAKYQAKWRTPLCGEYKNNRICGFGPPSSGGFTVLNTLKLLQTHNLHQFPANDKRALHVFSQASRLAFADRNAFLADSDFVNVPLFELLADEYIQQRTKLIQLKQDMGEAEPGLAVAAHSTTLSRPSTSHISIVDQWGNAVSMTTSIEMAFGSAVMTGGFLLNNQLTDFSFNPVTNGQPVANRVAANKRPRSSMAPTMVFNKKQQLTGILGSPGGSRIINYVTQTLIGVIDWQLDIQSAIDLPKITNLNGTTALEANTDLADQLNYFKQLGHKVQIRDLNSGLHAIWRTPEGWQGAADPRREGIAMGY
ncbi:gamma-glutamyltransferase [Gayadomonas joobiniege]|uniref:gamma-glutamyltransferase n=1 Tax=Gayadomonas joobiniege TaxID=1234606 RepID=UPI00036DE828|nr:gamma-glutamyltransferase [Gayadomonas joobiniege]